MCVYVSVCILRLCSVFVRACVYLRVYVSHAMNIHNNKNDTNPIRMSGMRPKMCVSMLTLIHSHEYQRPVEPTTNGFKTPLITCTHAASTARQSKTEQNKNRARE